jgi:hypothetical protein
MASTVSVTLRRCAHGYSDAVGVAHSVYGKDDHNLGLQPAGEFLAVPDLHGQEIGMGGKRMESKVFQPRGKFGTPESVDADSPVEFVMVPQTRSGRSLGNVGHFLSCSALFGQLR